MKWIDLFAGAGLATQSARKACCQVVAAVEYGYTRASGSVDRAPLLTYIANHGAHIVQQDIATISGWQFDSLKPDGIMGGPPCQDFSVAGKREGLSGYRGTLTFEFLRVAAESNATWILMENVPGILTSNSKKDIRAILGEAKRLGFHPAWADKGSYIPKDYHIFDAAHYGTPQQRRRVFFLWNKNGLTTRVPESTHRVHISMASALKLALLSDKPAPTIDAGGTSTGGWDLGQRSRRILKEMGFEGRLTVQQCAILQGVPEAYVFAGNDTSKYKQIGNGWAVPLGVAIITAIKSAHESMRQELINDQIC